MPSSSYAGERRSPRDRQANATGRRRVSWSASRLSYSSDAATAAWCSARESSDRHAPSGPWTRLATTAWVCRFGSPVRVSGWSNAATMKPARRDLLTPVVAGPGVAGVLLEVAEGVGDRGVMRLLDDRPGRRIGQRPQRRDGLGRGERQVEPGHRVAGPVGPPRPGGSPPPSRHAGPDQICRQAAIRRAMRCSTARVHPVPGAQRLAGDRVAPGPVQRRQLRLGDDLPGPDRRLVTPEAGKTGAVPASRRSAGRGVVRRQPRTAGLSCTVSPVATERSRYR